MDTNSFINQVKSYRKSTLNKALQLNSFDNRGPVRQFQEGGPTISNQSNYLSSKIDSVIAANKPFTIAKPINNKLLPYAYKELTPVDGQGTSENPFLLEPITIYPQKDQTVRYIQYNNSNDSDFANKQKYYTTYTDYDKDKLETYEKFEPTAGFSPIDFFLTNIFGNNAIGEQNERWKSYLHLNNNLPVKNGYYLTTPREKEAIRQYIDTASLKNIYDNYDYYNDKYNLELSKDDVGEMLDNSRLIMNNPNKTFSVNGDISLIKNSTADGTNETTSPLGGLRNFDITWDNKNNKIIVNDKYNFPKAANFFGVPDLDNTAPIIKDTIDYNPHKGSNLIYYLKNRDSLPKSIHSGHEIQKSLLDL